MRLPQGKQVRSWRGRDWVRLLRGLGFERSVQPGGDPKHVKYGHPCGAVLLLSHTAGDHRANLNRLGNLRRAAREFPEILQPEVPGGR